VTSVLIPVSVGELIDKVTILEIKNQRIDDPEKQLNICRELDALTAIVNQSIDYSNSDLVDFRQQLSDVNKMLWEVEDGIRECERKSDFSMQFIDLARSVYRLNDERAAIKRSINELFSSEYIEEKSCSIY
jgi:hypothetical protein